MKVRVTLVIMGLLGTLCHSSKLLKNPRVYNAFVTSHADLQPSQAYPVLAPVVQSVQYSPPRYVSSSNVYRMLVVPSQVQYSNTHSYSYSYNSVKEDYYQYNIVETGLPPQFELSTIPMIEEKVGPEETILFRPAVPAPVGHGKAAKVGDDRLAYFESSPAEQDVLDSRPLESNVNDVRLERAQRYKESESANVGRSSQPAEENDQPASTDEAKKPSTENDSNHYVEIEDAIKNNRPKDPSIVDVPPPPIPIVRRKQNKKPNTSEVEEFPPPAVGFI